VIFTSCLPCNTESLPVLLVGWSGVGIGILRIVIFGSVCAGR
jgi:hypothetical protein